MSKLEVEWEGKKIVLRRLKWKEYKEILRQCVRFKQLKNGEVIQDIDYIKMRELMLLKSIDESSEVKITEENIDTFDANLIWSLMELVDEFNGFFQGKQYEVGKQ